MEVHPTAIVHPDARLGTNVSIGAYSIIGGKAEIGDRTVIASHVIVEGRTRIGADNRIHQFACIGGPPQDKKYAGEDTAVEVGHGNVIREYVTINRGTRQDAGVTRIGDRNWIMAYVHFAHDCQIGSDAIFANACQIAGHVKVGDYAILGATTLVHQFVQIGAHAFTAMGTFVQQDLPPYVMTAGNPARPHGLNVEGLKRRGFSQEAIGDLKRAYRVLFRSGNSLESARQQIGAMQESRQELAPLVEFLGRTSRGIVR